MSFATQAAFEDPHLNNNARTKEEIQAQKEFAVRAWMANKESVCPYAPGLAKFVHLPEITSLSMDHVYYLAEALNDFYNAKEKGKRVGRWMLIPHEEWQSHDEAHTYSENIFWLLNAAYFHLINDKKSVQASLKKKLTGYQRGYQGEILNPVIGKQPNPKADIVPPKTLFYSALNPLYNSKRFYRYCPHSCMPLVYAAEFQELKEKHTRVTEQVAFEMAYGGLYEVFGDDLELNLYAFRKELCIWGDIIDRTAELMRASAKGVPFHSEEAKGCPASNLSYFRISNPQLIFSFYSKNLCKLPILQRLVLETGATPKLIINACFAGSGLYTIPEYHYPEDQRGYSVYSR